VQLKALGLCVVERASRPFADVQMNGRDANSVRHD